MTWIVTYTGRVVDLVDPQPDQIDIEDIAHALSRVCRFAGHVDDRFEIYSVAQHSVFVASMVPTLAALLHDAAEAYLGDFTRPLKGLLRVQREVPETPIVAIETIHATERRIARVIAAKYGFDVAELDSQAIHQADLVALMTEREQVLSPAARMVRWTGMEFPSPRDDVTILPQSIAYTRQRFLQRFEELRATREAQVA